MHKKQNNRVPTNFVGNVNISSLFNQCFDYFKISPACCTMQWSNSILHTKQNKTNNVVKLAMHQLAIMLKKDHYQTMCCYNNIIYNIVPQ